MSVSLVHSGLATEQRTTQWTPAAVPPTAVSASHFSAETEQTPVIKWIILLWGEVNKKFQGKKNLHGDELSNYWAMCCTFLNGRISVQVAKKVFSPDNLEWDGNVR